MNKREFLKDAIVFFPAAGVLSALSSQAAGKDPSAPATPGYDPTDHWYGMGIDVDKCIGCNRCVEAARSRTTFRTSRSSSARGWSVTRSVPTARRLSSASARSLRRLTRSCRGSKRSAHILVPKLCNQCAHPPCVQVCPVGATFQTKDGVVLVDEKRCIGCRYCIQACPYGARYLNPRTRTADKCTFCYHRVTKACCRPASRCARRRRGYSAT